MHPTSKILNEFAKGSIPWKRPWRGHGINMGVPRDFSTGKKFSGINIILLQLAAKENGYMSQWWGTRDQFNNVSGKPTEIESMEVYNVEQTILHKFFARPIEKPNFKLAHKVLHATSAKITYNENGEAWYEYPPSDLISLPRLEVFEKGIGGPQGYYETLAHEITHASEVKLGYNTSVPINELRANIGAAFMMLELGIPDSIGTVNFETYKNIWSTLLNKDEKLLSRICDSACKACDFILSFSNLSEERLAA